MKDELVLEKGHLDPTGVKHVPDPFGKLGPEGHPKRTQHAS